MKMKIKDIFIKKVANVLVMLLLLTFVLPYYASAVSENEEEEKGRGAVPAAVGEILQGITTVTDSGSANSSTSNGNVMNYPESGDGYQSLTIFSGCKFKNYQQGIEGLCSWWNQSYWGGTMQSAGCGPTAIAIIASGYGIDKNPGEVAKMMSMTSETTMSETLNKLGITHKNITSSSNSDKISQIKQNLTEGRPVIIGVGPGPDSYWTGSGHWMALLGINGNKVVVSNPGSTVKHGEYDLTELINKYVGSCILMIKSLPTTSTSSSTSSSGGNDTESNLAQTGYTGIHTSGITGKQFKEYKQNGDAPWAGVGYANGNTIGAWGCPLVSDAILCSGYGQDVTPVQINSEYSGGYTVGNKICSITGSSNHFYSIDKNKIVTHIKNGGTVMVHSYSQPFTSSEHYMAIIDVSSDGNQIYLSNPNYYGPNGWMNTDTTLNAMAEVMYVSAGGGSGSYGGNSAGITSLDNFLFIGDSRTDKAVGIYNKVKNEGSNIEVWGAGGTAPVDWISITETGSGTNRYWNSSYGDSVTHNITLPDKSKVKGVSIALGVNGADEIENMKKVLNNLLSRYPNTPIFVNSTIYVASSWNSYGNGASDWNSRIDNFNSKMQEFCNTNSNLYYIDVSQDLHKSNFLNDQYSLDGIHLNDSGNDKYIQNLKNAIFNSSASSGSSSNSIGNLTSNIAQYIKENGRGGYKIDIDLDKKVEELLALLKEENNKDINNFLKTSKRDEILKAMIKAELVTQFPDLRSASEIEASETRETNLKDIEENLPTAINSLQMISASSTEKLIEQKQYEKEEDLNKRITEILDGVQGQTKQDGENVIITYTKNGKQYRIEKLGTQSYNLYEVESKTSNDEDQEKFVYESLKKTNIQTKIKNLITTSNITRESVHNYFYSYISNVANLRGFDADKMEELYFSYINAIVTNLTQSNNSFSDWITSLLNGDGQVPEGELQGVIHVKRKSVNTTTGAESSKFLSYIPYDDFSKLCNERSSDSFNHFTINSNGEIIVAKFKQYNRSTDSAEGSVSSSELSGSVDTYDVSQTTISYLSSIYQHTMPFDLLWTLLVYSGDNNFIEDLTKLIFDTDITITALETITETSETHSRQVNASTSDVTTANTSGGAASTGTDGSETYTVTYTEYTKESNVQLKVSYINSWIAKYVNNSETVDIKENDPTTQTTTEEGTGWEQVGDSQELSAAEINSRLNSDSEFFSIYTRLVKDIAIENIEKYTSNSIESGKLSSAKELITKTDSLMTKYAERIIYVERLSDISLASQNNQGVNYLFNDELMKEVEKTANGDMRSVVLEVLREVYLNNDWNIKVTGGTISKYRKIDSIENNTTTSTKEYTFTSTSGQITEKTDPKADDDNFITVLNKNGKAKGSLRSIASWMFESIEKNRILCDKLDLMKYLLGIAFGKDYGVSEDFSFDIFDPENFSTTGSIGDFAGGDIKEKMWYALRKAGYSEIQAAAVMGNVEVESAGTWDTGIEEYTNSIGFGLIQWSFGRRTNLEKYAESKGKPASDEDIQIEYLLGEMTPGGGCSGYATYQFMNGFGYTVSQWENPTSIEEATHAFCWTFERPKVELDRVTPAKKYYDMYKGRDLSSFEKTSGENDKTSGATVGKYSSKLTGKQKTIVEAAESKNGVDLNEYIEYCYAKAGIALEIDNASSRYKLYSQAKSKGKSYPANQAKPGDLIFENETGLLWICVSNNGNGKLTCMVPKGDRNVVEQEKSTSRTCCIKVMGIERKY